MATMTLSPVKGRKAGRRSEWIGALVSHFSKESESLGWIQDMVQTFVHLRLVNTLESVKVKWAVKTYSSCGPAEDTHY